MTANIASFLQQNSYQNAPRHVDDVHIQGYRGVDSDSGPNEPDKVFPVPQYCRGAAESIVRGLSQIDSHEQFRLCNNVCTSYAHPQCEYRGKIVATDVFRSLYKDLNTSDVKPFFSGHTTHSFIQRFISAGLKGEGENLDRTIFDKAHQPSGLFQNSKRKSRLAELERAEPLLQGSTDFVFEPGSFVKRRLDSAVQITGPHNWNHSGYEPSAVVFELQKLAMVLAAAVPENTLRSSEKFRTKLQEILTHDYQANDTWQDKHQIAQELSSLYDHFKPYSYRRG